MAAHSSSHSETSTKNLLAALLIFAGIIVFVIVLAWRFDPASLVFSENFENPERNQQYLPCAAFTIEQGRLRVTVAESHSGCAVRLPNEYDDYTFTASVYPVQEVYDGSINVLFNQSDMGGYEIQFRPKLKEFNFIETAKNSNQETYIKFTTGWTPAPGIIFNNSENKIKLTVTEHLMEFWFNDVPVFKNTHADGFSLDQGIISIGAGAGEIGGIAFEFDNIEIYAERLYSRWIHDFKAIEESEK
jgi:hypothetical protein